MKKKSHRKDVILARIIFAAFCLIMIALIAGVVWYVREHHAAKNPDTEESQVSQESQQQTQPTEDTQDTEPVPATEPTEAAAPNPIVKTTTGVNLRKEPNTNCEVLTVLEEGTVLEVLGEEDGWANVDYQGRIGYVSMDYLEEVPQETDNSQGE